MKQLARVAIANHARPERHDLHIAACAHAGDGKLAERAFHLDQAQHQRHIQPGTLGFVPDGLQEIAAHLPLGLAPAQAVAHGAQPAQVGQARFGGGKVGLGRCLVGHGRTERGAHRVDQRLFQLAARVGSAGHRQPGGRPARQRHQAGAPRNHPGAHAARRPLRWARMSAVATWWRRCRGGAGTRPGLLSGRGRRW